MMQVSAIRPGLLVSVKISCRGNISYNRVDLERAKKDTNGQLKAKWQTEKVISDPDEFEQAIAVQKEANSVVRKACVYSAFGLLCPEDKEAQLKEAIQSARSMCSKFNDTSSLTKLRCYIMAGRVARDDVEAVQAIKSEVRDLLDAMNTGIANADVKAIRDAANRTRVLGQMLSADASKKVEEAIAVARETAKKIVKAGEAAAKIIDKEAIKSITSARMAFLDLDEGKEVQTPEITGRAIDLKPDIQVSMMPDAPMAKVDLDQAEVKAPVAAVVQLDLEDAIADAGTIKHSTMPEEAKRAKKREADKRRRDNKKKAKVTGKTKSPAKATNVVRFSKRALKAAS